MLVQHFTTLFNNKSRVGLKLGAERSALEVMKTYSWPGNVRELSNTIEGAFTFGASEWIKLSDLEFKETTTDISQQQGAQPTPLHLPMGTMEDLERDFVVPSTGKDRWKQVARRKYSWNLAQEALRKNRTVWSDA